MGDTLIDGIFIALVSQTVEDKTVNDSMSYFLKCGKNITCQMFLYQLNRGTTKGHSFDFSISYFRATSQS